MSISTTYATVGPNYTDRMQNKTLFLDKRLICMYTKILCCYNIQYVSNKIEPRQNRSFVSVLFYLIHTVLHNSHHKKHSHEDRVTLCLF